VDAAFSTWFVILLAAIAANLPFINNRLLAVIPVKFSSQSQSKPFWLRLIELIIFYFTVGGVAYLLEARIGNVFAQGWEFYAVTGCFFIVLAYPGFVFRYLRKRHG
jgi:hypothetical protein